MTNTTVKPVYKSLCATKVLFMQQYTEVNMDTLRLDALYDNVLRQSLLR